MHKIPKGARTGARLAAALLLAYLILRPIVVSMRRRALAAASSLIDTHVLKLSPEMKAAIDKKIHSFDFPQLPGHDLQAGFEMYRPAVIAFAKFYWTQMDANKVDCRGGAAIRITLFFYSVRYIIAKLDSVTGYPFNDRTAPACDKDGRVTLQEAQAWEVKRVEADLSQLGPITTRNELEKYEASLKKLCVSVCNGHRF